jgi:hypothetical protein
MTASTWASAIAPIAEWISCSVWQTVAKRKRQTLPATRLTQDARRKAKGGPNHVAAMPPTPPCVCIRCGKLLQSAKTNCASCGKEVSRENLIRVAKLGRVMTHRPKAQALRAATQRKQAAARKAWSPSNNPDWLTRQVYREKVQMQLSNISVPKITAALSISEPYATDIRAGKRIPHPRHWPKLARLVGISKASEFLILQSD